ncbi:MULTISPECIES: hypothetical protein [unclassified Microbacterium]|uniref:hypothetical protein n=1 Tax=unclassified Microbacterium TaxID=2609290 RepID=UPI003868156D
MAICDMCGNEYDKTFTLTRGEDSGTFDSFECAIHAMAPTYGHCGCAIIGHGVEDGGGIYCGAHCARAMGDSSIVDRARSGSSHGSTGAQPGAAADDGGSHPVPSDVTAGDIPPLTETP